MTITMMTMITPADDYNADDNDNTDDYNDDENDNADDYKDDDNE